MPPKKNSISIEKFTRAVDLRMKQNGWNQKDLSNELGRYLEKPPNQSTISAWLNGHHLPNTRTMAILLDILDIDILDVSTTRSEPANLNHAIERLSAISTTFESLQTPPSTVEKLFSALNRRINLLQKQNDELQTQIDELRKAIADLLKIKTLIV